MTEFRLRDARRGDFPEIAAIYGWHVLHGTGSFELEPPDEAEMVRRWNAVRSIPCPWLVAADAEDHVLGWCCAGRFNARAAYARTVEDSVYVAESARGRGVGKALLRGLIARLRAAGFRRLVSVVGDSANAGSIGLHRSLGMREAGTLHGCGEKFGRSLDIVFFELDLQNPEENVL